MSYRRFVLSLLALMAVSFVLAEWLIEPEPDYRSHLLVIIVAPGVLAVALTPLLERFVSSRTSVAGAVFVMGLSSLALGLLTSTVASDAMFLSGREFRLFLVILVLSSGIALVVGTQLTRPLARDVQRLGQVAAQVAAGDLTVRTGIQRNDEVGATAAAIDSMVQSLADVEAERRAAVEARQHLFTSLGHDLRTPLSAMRAALESIEDGVAADPEATIGVLLGQVRSMDAMLDQLVEFSRLEVGHVSSAVERVSLAELVDECVEALGPLAHAKRVRLRFDADGPATVTGSPLELSRVVRNLVDNAIRHSPVDGTVGLDVTSAVTPDGSSEVLLSVRDDGPGFPAEFREQAFEPFRRADPSRNARTGNTGLGLAICKAIVTAHGGRISLGDGPGGTVHVALPTVPVSPSATPSATTSANGPAS